MLVRMRVDVRGTFLGREPVTGLYSTHRGDVLNVPESYALQLIMTGQAETTLDGPVGRAGEKPPAREVAKLRAKIAELAAPDPIESLRDQIHERRKSGRPPTQAENEALRYALNL